ncbi:hypothetical protein EBT25_15075 [bacterium]|nr:hypothetical protein [bacterium]
MAPRFHDYHELLEWEKEHGIELEPTGTYSGNERVLNRHDADPHWVELVVREQGYHYQRENGTWSRVMFLVEHIVVDGKNGDYDIYHADDYEDALEQYEWAVKRANEATSNTEDAEVSEAEAQADRLLYGGARQPW